MGIGGDAGYFRARGLRLKGRVFRGFAMNLEYNISNDGRVGRREIDTVVCRKLLYFKTVTDGYPLTSHVASR